MKLIIKDNQLQMLIQEQVISEKKHYYEYQSTFTHDDIEYDLNKLFELSEDLPVHNMNVKRLKWILKYTEVDPDRVKEADIKYPVLVTPFDGKFVVLDGVHRLTKVIQHKKHLIKVKVIRSKMLNKCKLK